jgi:hypothetical protein
MTKITDIDAIVATARERCLKFIKQSEDRFVEDVTSRGGLTVDEALSVVREHHGTMMQDALDENMTRLRAWLERGGTDLH